MRTMIVARLGSRQLIRNSVSPPKWLAIPSLVSPTCEAGQLPLISNRCWPLTKRMTRSLSLTARRLTLKSERAVVITKQVGVNFGGKPVLSIRFMVRAQRLVGNRVTDLHDSPIAAVHAPVQIEDPVIIARIAGVNIPIGGRVSGRPVVIHREDVGAISPVNQVRRDEHVPG